MNTALREICELRNQYSFDIDLQNQNRYRLVAKTKQMTSAYYFSTPIYNKKNRRLIQRAFVPVDKSFVFEGSDSQITVHGENITLSNIEGSVTLKLPDFEYTLREGALCGAGWTLTPTFNGVCMNIEGSSFSTRATFNRKFNKIRYNDKCFAIMQDQFTPFFSLSPLMSCDICGHIYPAIVTYDELSDLEYVLNVNATDGNYLSFEINLHEPKLFLDTTVESKHPSENNAFGCASFLGKTPWMGEQWLYTRPDFSKLPEIRSHDIYRILFHIPRHPETVSKLEVYAPQTRFCSFGSTWNNKIAPAEKITVLESTGNYFTLDLTELLVDHQAHTVRSTQGLIIKCKPDTNNYCWIATGDSCTFTHILEVKYTA